MQSRLLPKGYKEIKVVQADMLDLPFDSESFDVVIEKGTMDVLFVDAGDPWNPRPETVSKVMATLDGVHRVLKPDNILMHPFHMLGVAGVFGGSLFSAMHVPW
jgi:ubiquinone/menaquinone biosynthesis C-methylase UbiE